MGKAAWWASRVEGFKAAWVAKYGDTYLWDRSTAGMAFHPTTDQRFCWYRDKKTGEIKWTRGWPGVPTK